MSSRLVFMGSPDFAIPILKILSTHFQVVGVVTQPDRQSGRGRKFRSPPVKELAINLGIPFIQPQSLKEETALCQLEIWQPEVIIVAAYGQILRHDILNLPPKGCINVHASLLPRWRGATPIPAAILNGDIETGVSVMQMDPGIDSGPILTQRAIPIQPEDTTLSLSIKLAQLGADLLIETLEDYLKGILIPRPQDKSKATLAPMLKKEDGNLDFSLSAQKLILQIRAYNPWPGTFTRWKDQRLIIHHAHALAFSNVEGKKPGKTIIFDNSPAVVTGKGLLVMEEVQLAGKKPISGQSFLMGIRDWGDGILTA
jgi:methionyl-tRNA formyltransferase